MSRYPPAYHLEQDPALIHRVMREYDFATLITTEADSAMTRISQIPLILDPDRGEHGVLIGHMHGANPQVMDLRDNKPVTALFAGPHAYISPMDYHTDQLPTWNYISVHALGTVRSIEGHDAKYRMMTEMVDHFESRRPGDGQRFVLDPDHHKAHAVLPLLHCFEIDISELIGRFKLSQDKTAIDTDLATQKLLATAQPAEAELIRTICDRL